MSEEAPRIVPVDHAAIARYREGHAARMAAAQKLADDNLRQYQERVNPSPSAPPEPPYDMSIERKPMAERTKLERLLSARFHLRVSMTKLDDRISAVLSRYQSAPCCSLCGARNLEPGFLAMEERQGRQTEYLHALDTKIAKASR